MHTWYNLSNTVCNNGKAHKITKLSILDHPNPQTIILCNFQPLPSKEGFTYKEAVPI